MAAEYNEESVSSVGSILTDKSRPLAERFRALFTLRNIGGDLALSCIAACFDDESALLKHECAYCMGQMQDERAVPMLQLVLADQRQDTMVRHEAGEALGAIGSKNILQFLEKYSHDPAIEVAETCELAIERIKWLHGDQAGKESCAAPYKSVDPAPPCLDNNTEQLRQILLDHSRPLFERYRAMFSLRNEGSAASVLALAEGLKCKSALFRHEIAYVLGQIQHEAAVKQLHLNLQDKTENYMVRHECAEALGAIATDECMDILHKYLSDSERVVKESCEVALDMCEYERSAQFQYADGLNKVVNSETSSS